MGSSQDDWQEMERRKAEKLKNEPNLVNKHLGIDPGTKEGDATVYQTRVLGRYPSKRKIFVIAHTFEQAKAIMFRLGFKDHEYRYVSEPSVLHGSHKIPLVTVGEHWKHPDWYYLKQVIEANDLKVFDVEFVRRAMVNLDELVKFLDCLLVPCP